MSLAFVVTTTRAPAAHGQADDRTALESELVS